MQTIITIFTVLSMYLNCSQDLNGQYYYNADIEDGIVKTMYVYEKSDNALVQYLSYDFTYDAQGRLTEKTVSRWDCWKKAYQPSYQLHIDYSADSYELTRNDWNERSQSWTPTAEKAVYHLSEGQLTGVSYMKRNGNGDSAYHTVKHLQVLDTYEGMLLAGLDR